MASIDDVIADIDKAIEDNEDCDAHERGCHNVSHTHWKHR